MKGDSELIKKYCIKICYITYNDINSKLNDILYG